MAGRTGFFAVIDEIHLARARRGDLDALESMYRLYSLPVSTLAMRICGSTHEAEEVVQETFLEVIRSLASFRGDGAFGAWLRRITVSKALTLQRKRRRMKSVALESVAAGNLDHDFQSTIDGRDSWRRIDLERALAVLPDEARVVVWLHDVEGLTHREIADCFGRSTSFSKSQLSRAHSRLRVALARTEGTGDASEAGRTVGTTGR